MPWYRGRSRSSEVPFLAEGHTSWSRPTPMCARVSHQDKRSRQPSALPETPRVCQSPGLCPPCLETWTVELWYYL